MQRYSNRLLRTRGFFDPIALRPIIGSSGALLVSASSASELPARIQFELSKFGIPAHMNSAKAQMTTEPLVQTGVEQAKRLGVSSIIGCGDKQALDRARGIQATLKNLHKYPVSLILVPSFISLTNYISEWQCVRAREGAIDAVLDSSQGYSPEVTLLDRTLKHIQYLLLIVLHSRWSSTMQSLHWMQRPSSSPGSDCSWTPSISLL